MAHPSREEWMEYLYDELDAKKRGSLTKHLRDCPDCLASVESWRSVMSHLDQWKLAHCREGNLRFRRVIEWVGRWAVAAVLLIGIGYTFGLLSGPDLTDVRELRHVLETSLKSSMESAVRDSVRQELNLRWLPALAESQALLKDELHEQLRYDLNQFATDVMAASSAERNELLAKVVRSMQERQLQQGYLIAAVLDQMKRQQLRNDALLRNDLASLAFQTGDELLQTKKDIAHLYAYVNYDDLIDNGLDKVNNTIERRPK